MGYHERFARSFQGAENADERGEMVLGLCPAGSCDRTYHGIRTYREVLEQYPYRLRAESRGSVIGSRRDGSWL